MRKVLSRAPCQAIQTRPAESVVATGQMSAPGADVSFTGAETLPPVTLTADSSKFASGFAGQLVVSAQTTQVGPLPSMATAHL